MTLNIPQHTPDATPWLISEKDDAWDHDRIDAELATHGLSADDHPFTRYQLAETRYDLDAPFTLRDGQTVPIRDYLHPNDPPARFKLRPLTPDEFATTQDMLLRGASSAAYTHAAKVGLTGLDGLEGVTFKKKRGLVDPKLVELLHRAGVLLEIGSAVYLLSKPLEGGRKKVVLLLALGRHVVDDSARAGERKIFQFVESHPLRLPVRAHPRPPRRQRRSPNGLQLRPPGLLACMVVPTDDHAAESWLHHLPVIQDHPDERLDPRSRFAESLRHYLRRRGLDSPLREPKPPPAPPHAHGWRASFNGERTTSQGRSEGRSIDRRPFEAGVGRRAPPIQEDS